MAGFLKKESGHQKMPAQPKQPNSPFSRQNHWPKNFAQRSLTPTVLRQLRVYRLRMAEFVSNILIKQRFFLSFEDKTDISKPLSHVGQGGFLRWRILGGEGDTETQVRAGIVPRDG